MIPKTPADNFITVLTVTYPSELAIIRGRLELEGIECFVRDELTAQVNPFYSNAIGGIKLQVKESDLENAMIILKETGYIKDSDLQPSKMIGTLDRVTSKIPIINKLRFELRLIIIATVIVGLIVAAVFLAMPPQKL